MQFKGVLKRIVKFVLFAVLTFCFLIYLPCNMYDFKTPEKFSGNFLYNPYKNPSANWQKTNFHAHAVAWNGITNGKQQAQKILDLYKQKNYAYACISNYESIAKEDAQPGAIEVYEHGYNIYKTHQLVIMPQQVCYNDFPLWQFTSSKQFVINKLSNKAKAVVVAHPLLKHGYSDKDLKKISGYNLMEVLNHSGNASCKWDIALSAGKPVWIIGDDDTHDVYDPNQTFVNWTMIDCSRHNKDSLVNSLIAGNAYAVNGRNSFNDNKLLYETANGMQMKIAVALKADSIKLIGENGIIKKTGFNTDKIDYIFKDNDSYIRAVIYNKQTTMYLNPVIRYNGISIPQNITTATININDTFLYRSMLIAGWLIILVLFYFSKPAKALKPVFKHIGIRKKVPENPEPAINL